MSDINETENLENNDSLPEDTNNESDVESHAEKELKSSLPNMLLLGYQEATTKKDLITYINSKANELLNIDTTKFNIVKNGNGYYWELQEGGSGKGVLKSLISTLDYQDEVYIKISNKTIRVTRKKHSDGIDAFVVNSDDEYPETDTIEFKDKMKPLTSKGTGVLLFGFLFSLLGLFSLMLSFAFKYGVLDKTENVQLKKIEGTVPYTQYNKVKEVLNLESTYIDVITYNPKTGQYLIKTGQEELPENKEIKMSEPKLPDVIINNSNEDTLD